MSTSTSSAVSRPTTRRTPPTSMPWLERWTWSSSPPGTRIVEAGEAPLDDFFVVRTGEVEVIDAIIRRLVELTDVGADHVPHRTSWLLLLGRARPGQHGTLRPAPLRRRRQRDQFPVHALAHRRGRHRNVVDH
ncbi:hypothetical protein MPY17_04575 [Rhodococcus opacus]|uniref:hypothetical protein n=1 Tax=Rhodococcus opacus TaxID=37919 RepID=UPI001FF21226|nr:hypothetical protein [Rhodococcus opacus]UOT05042.1 hypothetical protein MPY17_04575 [Rhodococcus opacus]